MLSRLIIFLAIFCSIFLSISALDNGLALTPPMGWMTWQRFRCITDCQLFPDECISDTLIRRTAHAMATRGFLDAGYEYVIIDDCWPEKQRDSLTGKLVPDRERFPYGMKDLSDYVHSLGLKFGLYQDYGTLTCAGYPGIIGSEALDAQTFADWGVDYVKLDGCNANISSMDTGYPLFGDLLRQTGRPMVYSCSWPDYVEASGIMPNFDLIKRNCNLWRNYDDIDDSWDSVQHIAKYFGDNQDRIAPNAGPGHWNDPDMLVIGNFGLSIVQAQAQMALWAILAGPLLMSTDLDALRPEFAEILLHRGIIAINQDPLGIQGRRVLSRDKIDIWTRPLLPNDPETANYALAFISGRTDGQRIPVFITLLELGLSNPNGYRIVDLYDKTGQTCVVLPNETLTVIIKPSGCRFYYLTAI